MYLSKITVKNLYLLYLLKDVSTKLEKDITLMIGEITTEIIHMKSGAYNGRLDARPTY